MESLIPETVMLITELNGSLVYHLVLLFALQTAASLALNAWRRERGPTAARLTIATALAVLLNLLSLVGTLLAALQLIDPLLLPPPLTRAVSTLSLLLMLWAFAFPSPSRPADALTLGLALIALIAAGVSAVLWDQALAAGVGFYNGSLQETVWEVAQLALAGGGLLLISVRGLLRRIPDAWLGTVFLLVIGLGHVAQLFFFTYAGANLPGAVRLAEIVAVPLFTALVYRRLFGGAPTPHPVPASSTPASTAQALEPLIVPAAPGEEKPPAARSLDPKAVVALASLNASADPDELAQIVSLAVAHTCRAELCLLLTPPDDLGMCRLTCAYDLVREQFLPGTFLSAGDSPALRAALTGAGLARLTPADHAADLRRLTGAVGIGPIGPALVAPIRANGQPLAVLVLIALYSHRAWTPEDENLLAALLEPIADALSGDNQINRLLRDLAKASAQADAAEAAQRAARAEADQLSVALEAARGEAERLTQEIIALRQATEHLRPADDVEALRSTILAVPAPDLAEVEAEWRSRVDAAEAEAEAQARRAADLAADLDALRDRLQDAEDRRSELEAELEPLRANLAAFAAQTAELERLRAAHTGTPTTAPETAAAELAQLRAELEAARRDADRQREEAADRAAEMEAELERLRAGQAAALQNAERLAELEAELAAAAEWRLKHAAVQRELEAQAQRISQLETERAAAVGWREKYETAQRDLNAQAQRVAQLQGELEQARASRGAADPRAEQELEAERARLEAQLRELRDYAESQHWQMATFKLDYDFALQQEQQLRKELELTRAELRRMEADRPAAPAAPGVAPEALAEARKALAAAEAALAETRATLAATRSELETTQAALSEARNEASAKERQLVKAQAVVATLNDQARQLAEVQSEFNDLKTQLAGAQSALANLRRQIAARDQALAEAQEKAGAKEQELANAMAALAELANQTHQLTLTQKQLAEKERQLAEARANLPAAGAATGSEARPFLPEASMEVIASLTQELRQPMAAIMGYSELLLGESVGILGALQRKFLERVKASCERMDSLINDLIRVTDIDAGTLQIVPESLDVMYILEDAILSCGAQYREKGINLRLDIAEDLPPISADRDALRQIVAHLLSNAGNAAGADGDVVLKVRAEAPPAAADPAGHALLIAVRDSGGGIAAEDQPRVFQRFYRADAPLIAGLGETGVGLSVAKALVEAHGGRIWLTSEPGQGSTFTVLLPIHGRNGASASH